MKVQRKSCLDENIFLTDPSTQRESWRLVEGFVAEEGKAILPHLTRTRPNLVDNHMALILYAFINAQLLEVSPLVTRRVIIVVEHLCTSSKNACEFKDAYVVNRWYLMRKRQLADFSCNTTINYM